MGEKPTKPGRRIEYPKQQFIDVFDDRDDDLEPLTATGLAEIIGCSQPTAYNKLQALEADGELVSKKAGRNRVYWRPE